MFEPHAGGQTEVHRAVRLMDTVSESFGGGLHSHMEESRIAFDLRDGIA